MDFGMMMVYNIGQFGFGVKRQGYLASFVVLWVFVFGEMKLLPSCCGASQ